MALPRWVEVLMLGHRRKRTKPIPRAEFEKWREEESARFREGAQRIRSTVDSTCEIVNDLKSCVHTEEPKSHAPNGAH